MSFKICHFWIELETQQQLQVLDISSQVKAQIQQLQCSQGQLLLAVQHTTTALTINENEARLWQDMQNFYDKLAPASDRYLHNDLHLRNVPDDEPENAHSHLIAMFLNTNETIGIQNSQLVLGQYQSILFLELDGPRNCRKIYGQFLGECL